MTLAECLAAQTALLAGAGLDQPRLEAEVLAASVLACRRLDLLLARGRALSREEAGRITAACARRARGEPSAHITGAREFYGRDFTVTPATLVPRPETELLVDTALEAAGDGSGSRRARFADLGAGTGCVGITLCLERPGWEGVLLEKDPAAAAVARSNAKRLGAAGAVAVIGDMFAPPLAGGLDFIVANPPYIAEAERPSLTREVAEHEPAAALFSGDGGLRHLKAAVRAAARLLRPGGLVALEHGMTQAAAVRAAMAAAGMTKIVTKKDLAGLDRVTSARI